MTKDVYFKAFESWANLKKRIFGVTLQWYKNVFKVDKIKEEDEWEILPLNYLVN